jgi:hypothetical protein
MTTMHPITWCHDLQKNNSPWLYDIDCFIGDMQRMYGNVNWRLNAARKSDYDIPQG